MITSEVQEKARSAINYCNYASGFTAEYGGKSWKYALIPHDVVTKNSSFKGLVVPRVLNSDI
jgi:type III restriction enzyme